MTFCKMQMTMCKMATMEFSRLYPHVTCLEQPSPERGTQHFRYAARLGKERYFSVCSKAAIFVSELKQVSYHIIRNILVKQALIKIKIMDLVNKRFCIPYSISA